MTTRLVLRKDIPELGAVGDVVKVADGFARNYLLPRGLAYPVTPDNLKRLESEKKHLMRIAREEKARSESLAGELAGRSFSIPVKANEEGHLYGSVDAAAIASALQAEKVPVQEKAVLLEEPIKELGIYEVDLRLHPDVTARTKIWVVSDETPGEAPAPGEPAPDPPPPEETEA